ncbi:MAG: hypothetical protein VX766_00100 [Pseudomonadota bacterium]|nr:hypothetical protein [Pseudomonadota bacterium]
MRYTGVALTNADSLTFVAALVPLPTILCTGLSLLAHSVEVELDTPVET